MTVSTTIATKRSTHLRINVIKIGKGIGFAREEEEGGRGGWGGGWLGQTKGRSFTDNSLMIPKYKINQ